MDEKYDGCKPPNHILGFVIRSRTRIFVSYLIPICLELLVYIVQIIADIALSYQYFHTDEPTFGWGTLSLIVIPPLLTFILITTSKAQRKQSAKYSNIKFFFMNLWKLLLFPFISIYRYTIRLFWAIEALFHDDNDTERMACLDKTEESSSCELYHFIKAYAQSAPQIILQLYYILTQDLFRNYETTTVQAISIVFAAIDLAVVTRSYQRFESQKQVGRVYPWSSPVQVETQRQLIDNHNRLKEECQRKKRESERTISSFPESDKIMANFKQQHCSNADNNDVVKQITSDSGVENAVGYDEVDNDSVTNADTSLPTETKVLIHSNSNDIKNVTTANDIETSPKLRLKSVPDILQDMDEIEVLDTIPNTPPPLPPISLRSPASSANPQISKTASPNTTIYRNSSIYNRHASKTFSQLGTFKDMLIVNAQIYIKQNVPHPPKLLTSRIDDTDGKSPLETPLISATAQTPLTPKDVTDFFFSRPTMIVNGIQQEDAAAKTIAFFGWISFIIMRMLSLATFIVFFPTIFFIIISIHYIIMLTMLFLESKFKSKLNRTFSYFLLAYVYIFVILEFRIKFQRIKLWFTIFFILTMSENIFMTTMWYATEKWESWWFGFIFESIVYTGILFIASLLVYYFMLKPKDVTLIVESKGEQQNE